MSARAIKHGVPDTARDRITVLVADDHPMYRTSVVRALKHDARITVVAEFADGRSALDGIRELKPAVALIDLKMPALDGAGVLQAVTRDALDTRVVLLSGAMTDQDVYDGLALGAAAMLPKTVEATQLLDAVLAVARGETVVAPELQGAIANQIRMRSSDDRPLLTSREREILAFLADGLSNAEIAGQLFLSPSTIKTHLEKLYSKLEVRDRGSAVAAGIRRGLIE
jgi:two-component system, NarL family, nitrate/nitrite response regulator NarL